ncbi:dienelactone hydrolase family protein [Microlunatus sp. GCM10028923]|uniref:dienelactone hydrolase family protein n=1 Tax=Microlunatus sp. GCM10028923 TaxID=3273400 RepID=UPI003609570A
MITKRGRALDRAALHELLGGTHDPRPLDARIEGESQEDGYVRRHVTYPIGSERASVFVCVPTELSGPAPIIFCHHQHAGQFDLGKSEVCGLRGDPDQAYAAELAQRGFVTIAPDAIGFEDRNWTDGENITWFELSTRLVMGRSLLGDCLREISVALDYASTLPEANASRIGFIGHSYGGRMAMWAPAWDPRITASVSNCGCIPYRDSFTRDTGMQAELVVPGFAARYDVEDVLAVSDQCRTLIMATDDDRWSRGAEDIARNLGTMGVDWVTVEVRPGRHDFPRSAREHAYEFLSRHLLIA